MTANMFKGGWQLVQRMGSKPSCERQHFSEDYWPDPPDPAGQKSVLLGIGLAGLPAPLAGIIVGYAQTQISWSCGKDTLAAGGRAAGVPATWILHTVPALQNGPRQWQLDVAPAWDTIYRPEHWNEQTDVMIISFVLGEIMLTAPLFRFGPRNISLRYQFQIEVERVHCGCGAVISKVKINCRLLKSFPVDVYEWILSEACQARDIYFTVAVRSTIPLSLSLTSF